MMTRPFTRDSARNRSLVGYRSVNERVTLDPYELGGAEGI